MTTTHGTMQVADQVSVGTLLTPAADPIATLVLAHGAGAPMDHTTMNAIAEALRLHRVATFRFNFPFKEQGRSRVDAVDVATATIARAVDEARKLVPGTPLFVGGHSFGGRMASHAALDHDLRDVRGLVFFSFPLHPAGKPGVTRAAHLSQVAQPMLFASGTRDALATPELLTDVVRSLGARARLVWLNTADHGYRVLKRSRTDPRSVFDELAAATAEFMSHEA